MNKPNRKSTVQDVAEIAKVSVATVSRTLSKPHKVSEQTRQIVMAAIKETGYTVNEAARNLRRQQTDTILILVPGIGSPVFSNVVKGIEKVFASKKINVLIVDTKNTIINHDNAPSYFSQNKVDGIVILDGLVPVDVLDSVQNAPPIVFAGEWQEGTDYPVAYIDDLFGSGVIARHFNELGHTKFGQVTGRLDNAPGINRRLGYLNTLESLGFHNDNLWEFNGDYTLSSGKDAAMAWLALPDDKKPTAVFCACDEMAFSFITTLRKMNINIPDDVSVVGYDDWEVSEYFVPALTTVHQPRIDLGIQAAETLLSLIKENSTIDARPIQPWLVIRESTCPPKH